MKDIKKRSCVVCRKREDKDSLVRFVKSGTRKFSLDLLKIKNGRGAYCHLDLKCLLAKNVERSLIFSLNKRVKTNRRDLDSIVYVIRQALKNKEELNSLKQKAPSVIKKLEQIINKSHNVGKKNSIRL